MPTNFRQERMVKEQRQKIYGALFLILVIIVLGRSSVLGAIGRFGHLIGLPLWHSADALQASGIDIASMTRTRASLIEENKVLHEQAELSDLRAKTIDALVSENEHLKELMGRDTKEDTVLARVLSRPPFEVYDTFIIDVGMHEGVSVGALVYGKGSFVIGSISRVMDRSSVVTLASAPGETRSVMVAESSGDEKQASSTTDTLSEKHNLVFAGIGGGGFRAQVPKQLHIAPGTMMALPTLNPSFIGIITTEYVPEDGSLKEIYGTLPFGINSLEWVKVVLALRTPVTP
ncbi:MAG TPA: rod shape-determining protein MreC [Candidatus Paceibacterota bacterium]|nr:rod shape-determining protein MreC [Candidatus Paceibacterota bacterium]